MKELMEMLYAWDDNRPFLLVELHRLELVDNCCKAGVVPREDAITRLFDLDLFGWQVRSYTWMNGASGRTILRIEVYGEVK